MDPEEWKGLFDLSEMEMEDVVDEEFLDDYGEMPDWSAEGGWDFGSIWNMISGPTARNVLNIGSGLYGLYESRQMREMAKKAFGASDPFGPYRQQYADQLSALMKDPSSITKDPGYEFQFNQGREAINRSMGAKGYLGSGNLGIALTEYGQNYAQNYFTKKAEQLAGLAGAGISPNFSGALSGYGSGIDAASAALASLGYGSVMAGGASQGTPKSERPSSAGGEAAALGQGLRLAGNAAGTFGYGDLGKGLGGAGNLVSGLSEGGVEGYGQALRGAASLAEVAGYGGTTTASLKTIGSAASGNLSGTGSGLQSLGAQTGVNWLGAAGSYLATAAGLYGAYDTLANPKGKFATAMSGASSGMALANWPGAIVGGVAGYLRAGGFSDTNPIDASGFSGISMDQAVRDENLARMISNPLGSIASLAGIKSNSLAGKIIDPAGALGGGRYEEEDIRNSYYNFLHENDATTTNVSPEQFYQALAGEFRGSRSAYPARSSGAYGKFDEDRFVMDLANKINQSYSSGTIEAGATPQDILNKVVTPWFEQDFGGWRTDIPQDWVKDQQSMTLDLINRFISGSPVEWGKIKNQKSEFEVPEYLGLGKVKTPVTPEGPATASVPDISTPTTPTVGRRVRSPLEVAAYG
jgi:hypothetical protein